MSYDAPNLEQFLENQKTRLVLPLNAFSVLLGMKNIPCPFLPPCTHEAKPYSPRHRLIWRQEVNPAGVCTPQEDKTEVCRQDKFQKGNNHGMFAAPVSKNLHISPDHGRIMRGKS
jgi:hypothetical protein